MTEQDSTLKKGAAHLSVQSWFNPQNPCLMSGQHDNRILQVLFKRLQKRSTLCTVN